MNIRANGRKYRIITQALARLLNIWNRYFRVISYIQMSCIMHDGGE